MTIASGVQPGTCRECDAARGLSFLPQRPRTQRTRGSTFYPWVVTTTIGQDPLTAELIEYVPAPASHSIRSHGEWCKYSYGCVWPDECPVRKLNLDLPKGAQLTAYDPATGKVEWNVQ